MPMNQDWVRDQSSIWVATGFSKETRDAPMSIYRYSNAGLEQHWTQSATRNQITDLSLIDGRLFIAKFSTGTSIHGGWLEDKFQPIVEANMAMHQRPLPEFPDKIVVGRLYGDEPRSDGDLTIWNLKAKTRSGKRQSGQTHRGQISKDNVYDRCDHVQDRMER